MRARVIYNRYAPGYRSVSVRIQKMNLSTAKTIPGLYWGDDHQQPRCEFASGGTPPNSKLTTSLMPITYDSTA